MELLVPLSALVVVQLYWLSILVIGFVTFRTLQSILKRSLIEDWAGLPVPAKIIVSMATGFGLFSLVTLVGYVLHLPAWWLGLSYIAALFLVVIHFINTRPWHIATKLRTIARFLRSVKLFSAVGLLLVLLVIDYALSLAIGGYLGGDGFIHISKVRHLAEQGFSLTDAYYGTVPETRHHLSVLHTLYAVPVWFGIDAQTSWLASLAWLRLCGWLAIFYLAWRLLNKVKTTVGDRMTMASCATIIGMGLWGTYLMNYPGKLVIVWVALFVIGLLDAVRKKNLLLLLLASLLVAFSHSLVALSLILLLGLVFVALALFDRRSLSRQFLITITASSVILIITPVFSYLLPNQMTEAARNYGAENYNYWTVGNMTSLAPNLYQYLGGNFGLPISVLSVIGLGALFYWQKARSHRVIIACILLFVPLTIYNPVFATLAKDVLPVWAQTRFLIVNVLTLVAVPSGLVAILLMMAHYIQVPWYRSAARGILIAVSLIVLVLFQTFNKLSSTTPPGEMLTAYQRLTHYQMQSLQQLVSDVSPGSIVMAERYYDNFMLPAVAPVHVVAISEGNSTPAADMMQRTQCYEHIYKTLRYDLLSEAKVDYVIAQKGTLLHANAKSKPFLLLVDGNPDRELFKVIKDDSLQQRTGLCNFNE